MESAVSEPSGPPSSAFGQLLVRYRVGAGLSQEALRRTARQQTLLYEAALALGAARGYEYIVGAANLDLSVLCAATNEPEAGYGPDDGCAAGRASRP